MPGKPPRDQFFRKLPASSTLIYLAGAFVTFSIIGFVVDIFRGGTLSNMSLIMQVIMSGCFAVIYASLFSYLPKHSWKIAPLVFILNFLLPAVIVNQFGVKRFETPLTEAAQREIRTRLVIDGFGILVCMAGGYALFVTFLSREGERFFRAHTEIELAAEIHRTLVPPIALRSGDYEFYAHSVPSGEVGGDLVDVVETDGKWIAYLADVSGHGVGSGVVMAMFKSAVRMQLAGSSQKDFLGKLNAVIKPLLKPNMFATFAYLAQRDGHLEFATAGHPPIHCFRTNDEVVELGCANIPIGMLEGIPFSDSRFDARAGDLFVLLTDGILEAADARGEEFGEERVRTLLRSMHTAPLADIAQALTTAVNRFGARNDDQSLLLVRCLAPVREPVGSPRSGVVRS